ncbi:methyl-accepting chemotaxis protein [Celeribacter halophilus]|uniref:Methyl-accepting chemotaxis sensory transducer with Pas/Pac sensor n=1 Tax=Celeribacter halophilus TaxID=576117 RepID=A0A1I3P4A3_9RHOB|nr:PAS domain-containing methyl-accepting chemotaxis protein [Celeribacter halophilus]PZX14738.1 methyl-accepting chemotaxis sensory transducer with Pas/Pac sensor [Celeribacter halophilus]SFJ15886.1 methyl-accepting chemotaxis sensory transducer with Pas/Pac sensor [Celeribacter halophilus]
MKFFRNIKLMSKSSVTDHAAGRGHDATVARDDTGGIDPGAPEEALHDKLLKTASFEASPAALILLDDTLKISVVNPAAQVLLKQSEDAFRQHFGLSDAEDIRGKNLSDIFQNMEVAQALQSGTEQLPYETEAKVGELHFALKINAVTKDDGARVGHVLEMADITESRSNKTVLSVLDSHQVRAEFSPDGQLRTVNGTFAQLLGLEANDLLGKRYEHIFDLETQEDGGHKDVWARVTQGESIRGRFKFLNSDEEMPPLVEGIFSPLLDGSGRTSRIIFLGMDVTESQAVLRAADADRERMKAEQDRVVEDLRIGLKKLAGGDLRFRIVEAFFGEYETLRKDFNHAVDNLHDAMRNVVENADMIRSEASEISNAADDLSRRTEQQAATLEQTATALDQLTSSVRSAADGANQASVMVDTAKTNAEASGKVVQQAVEAMSEIETSSNQISKITSVIDDIAFQTNLLALNAGVEAARAGEAGRGFAVVASEVRALAQRSSDAAREINDLISKSGDLVKRGVSLVGETGEALSGIVRSVSEISNNVSEIAVSSREQSSGLAEINTAVNQLDQVTQQNAAMFEETTAASHALTKEAENLTQTTSRFSIAADHKASAVNAGKMDEKGTLHHLPENPSQPSQMPVGQPSYENSGTLETIGSARKAVNAPETMAVVLEDDWEDF